MKRTLLTLLLALPVAALAQAPILRNSLDTNTLGTNLTWNPITLQLRVSGATPSLALWNTSGSADGKRFDLTDAFDQLRFGWLSDSGGTARILGYFDTNGNLSILATGTADGVVASNSFRLVSGGGASKVLTSDANGVGTWQTASSGGASVWVPNTALSYSGSNVVIDGSGGTNFYLALTGATFFATPANIPASKATNTSFTVYFQQPSTGTCLVTWTNASFKFPGGSQFQPLTNASSVSWVSFTMSPFTNGIFMGDYGVLDSR